MVSETEQRIAERTAIAYENLQEQGFIGRGMNRTGLAAANTMDRVQSPVESHTGAFLGGAVIGAVAGAGLGIVACILLACITPVMFSTVLTIVGLGAAAMSLYEGNKAVKRQTARQCKKHASDRVAETFGAVPGQTQGRTQEEQEQIDALVQPKFIQRLEREERRRQRAERRPPEEYRARNEHSGRGR